MADEQLESWKAIAAHLGRDASTVRRWERAEGLPVHRHRHLARSSVYAFPAELDAWRAGRRPVPVAEGPQGYPILRLSSAVALAAVTVLSVVGGRWLGVPRAAAQEPGVTARLEWSGNVDTMGQVTRDGRFLSFTDWETGDLAIRELATGTSRRLTASGSMENGFAEFSVPSPDGRRVAYAWYDAARRRYDMRLVPVGGGEPTILLRQDEVEWAAPYDWSPDGGRILAALVRGGTAQLVLITVPGGAVSVLKSFQWLTPGAAAFSPDGRFVAYDLPSADDIRQTTMYVLAADGSREEVAAHGTSVGGVLGWSPEGSSLLVTGDFKGRPGVWRLAIHDGRAAGEPLLVRPLDGRITRLGIESDGDVHYAHAVGGSRIYIADVDPTSGTIVGAAKPLGAVTAGARRAVWSPDGDTIAFVKSSPQRGPSAGLLAIYSPATEQLRSLPLRMTYPGHLAWLPDGRTVLVQGRDDRGRGTLYRVDLSTGGVSRVCEADDHPPVVSRDGSVVYVRREIPGAGSDIVEVRLSDGRERVALAESTAMFALSPDRSTWVLVRPGNARRAIVSIVTGNGDPRDAVLPEGTRPLLRGDWLPDGSRLLVAGAARGRMDLLSLALDDGMARPVGVGFSSIHWASAHPSGSRVAITATENVGGAEIWVMSGLAGSGR